jgi:ATP-dependent RNA helicase DeaD
MEFSQMGLDPAILKAVTEMGFSQPTPIQEQGIPLLLQGEDLIGQAQTGTGKTAAFGICILEKLFAEGKGKYVEPGRPHALVLCPTRELAVQVSGELDKIGKYTGCRVLAVYGGQDIERQFSQLQRGVDVVVGTPGRVMDHMERGTLKLDKVQVAVLDEADRMLDMGFREDIEKILQQTSHNRQTMLFSATLPTDILELGKHYMKAPQEVRVSEDSLSVKSIKQFYIEASKFDKLNYLLALLQQKKPKLALIFCRTKRGAERINEILEDRGFHSMALHGDMSQNKRDRSMEAFRKQNINILVATDLASRGLDVTDISHVINYDTTDDPYTYVHRIGRTGRMGKDGEAISFIFFDQASIIPVIEKVTDSKMEQIKLEFKPEDLPKRVRFTARSEGGRDSGRRDRRDSREGGRSHSGGREGGHGREGGRSGPGGRSGGRDSRGGRGGRRDLRQSNSPAGEPREYQSSRGHSYFGRRN